MHITRVTASLLEPRLDAQYYRPDFLANEASVRASAEKGAQVRFLGDALGFFDTGIATKCDGSVPLLKTKSVRDGTVFPNDYSETVSAPVELQLASDDVVLCTYGTGSIGKTAFVGRDFSGQRTVDYTIAILRTRQDQVDPAYLSAFLRSRHGQQQIARHTKGTTGITFVLRSDLTRVLLPVFPPNVQAVIGDRIRQAEALRAQAAKLTGEAELMIEGLVDGFVSASDLVAASTDSHAGDSSRERRLLQQLASQLGEPRGKTQRLEEE